MNRKQLTILIVLVALVGGAGWIIFKKQNATHAPSDQKLGQKLFADLPINDVTQIHIQQSGADLNLVKKDDPYILDQSKEALNWSIDEWSNLRADFSGEAATIRRILIWSRRWRLRGAGRG